MTNPPPMKDDLVGLIERDDHARGCEGRWYACSCGYEARIEAGIRQAATRIEALEAEKAEWLGIMCHLVEGRGRDLARAIIAKEDANG